MERIARYPWSGPPILTRAQTDAQVTADALKARYFQNTRATTARLAGELRSEYDTVRRAALLRLVRRLGFATSRDVWRTAMRAVDRGARASDWRFRLECQIAAGAILAGVPRDA